MGRIAAALAAPARPVLIAFRRFVFEVRRVNSDDMRRVGYAVLEGEAAVKAAEREIKADRRKAQQLLKQIPAAKREAEEKKLLEGIAEKELRRIEAMLEKPSSQVALLERCNAYICAAVTGAGMLRDDLDEDGEYVIPTPPFASVVAADNPAEVLKDLRSAEEIEAGKRPVYVEQIRYVQDENEQDPNKGLIWVHALPESDREMLGGAILVLQGVASEVKPFRFRPGAPREARWALEAVREVAPRSADAATVADGLGGGVPESRARGTPAKSKGQQGMASRRR